MKATRKPEIVQAFQLDGTNNEEIQKRLNAHVGTNVPGFAKLRPQVGQWVILQASNSWRLMTDALFELIYDIEVADAKGTVTSGRSCWDCVHYWLVESRGRCSVFEEDIDSEILAAVDCPAYEPEI